MEQEVIERLQAKSPEEAIIERIGRDFNLALDMGGHWPQRSRGLPTRGQSAMHLPESARCYGCVKPVGSIESDRRVQAQGTSRAPLAS